MVTRSTPAIVLGPMGNLQGTYKFLSLATRKKVKRRAFTPYPMPDLVIKKVKAYGKLTTLLGIFDFADRNGILFEWNEEAGEFPDGIVEVDDIVLYPSLATEHPGVVLKQHQPLPSIEEGLVPQGRPKDAAACNANLRPFDVAGVAAAPIIHANAGKFFDYEIDNDDGIIAVGDIPQQPPHVPLVVNDTDDNVALGSDDNDDDDDSSDKDVDNELAAATDVPEGNEPDGNQGVQRSRRRGKGITKKYANYSLLMAARQARRGGQGWALIRDGCVFFSSDDLSDTKPIPEEDREEFALGVALIHYSMNAGIKKFKAKGEAGVTKELTQMHDMNVFCPIKIKSLTYDKKKKALSLLMFLKEKRDSSVKARMCADGQKQKDGTWSKQETTFPTVAMESVFITAVINVHEGRNVACFDILGAFLHADVNEDITMVLKGRLAELMVQEAPNLYRKYIMVDRKGTAILYVKMQKALYGLLRSALFFYKKLVSDLESDGSVLNPYDSCMANKVVDGKQMMVCWHVDDLKVSHCDPTQVTIF